MADPTAAPAAAPAPTTSTEPSAQPGGAPRGPDGKFAPAPKAVAPEAPRRLKLPTGEEMDEAEVLATASEKRLENRALQARLKRLDELEALEKKLKADPLHHLSAEEQRKHAIRVAREWQAQQEEANLPPEQKAFLQRQRDLEAREAKLKEAEDARTQEAEAAQMAQLRTEAVEDVKAAVDISGLPKTAATYKRLFGLMATATKNGVAYPAEVLARKLRASYDADVQEDFKALGGKSALKRFPALVEQLNALDDEEALALLGPLGERLRRRALEGRGLAAAAPAQPSNVRQLPQTPKAQGQREDPHEVQMRIEARARQR